MIYTNMNAVDLGKHGIFESSRMKATDIGHLFDALVNDGTSDKKAIAIDNGVGVKIGGFTGNGLQEVEATVAGVKDKIAVTGAPEVIKDAFTKAQASIVRFYNIAGNPVKSYEVVPQDIFGIADYQFTDASAKNVKVGAYVSVDGTGKWVAATSSPTASATGFIGKIHSISVDNVENVTIVRIECVQNTQIA